MFLPPPCLERATHMPEGGNKALQENNELSGKKADIFNGSAVETKEITAESRSDIWENPM
jgi:hypothetical protein